MARRYRGEASKARELVRGAEGAQVSASAVERRASSSLREAVVAFFRTRIPTGYEDEDGFHFGERRGAAPSQPSSVS